MFLVDPDRPKSQKILYTINPEVKTYQLRCEWYIFLHFTDLSFVYSTQSRKWVDPGWLRTLLDSLQNLKIQLKYLSLTRLDSFFRLFHINFLWILKVLFFLRVSIWFTVHKCNSPFIHPYSFTLSTLKGNVHPSEGWISSYVRSFTLQEGWSTLI